MNVIFRIINTILFSIAPKIYPYEQIEQYLYKLYMRKIKNSYIELKSEINGEISHVQIERLNIV